MKLADFKIVTKKIDYQNENSLKRKDFEQNSGF